MRRAGRLRGRSCGTVVFFNKVEGTGTCFGMGGKVENCTNVDFRGPRDTMTPFRHGFRLIFY